MTTFLVTGASGHLGALVLTYLNAANPGQIIAGSRDPSKLTLSPEIARRKVDFDDANLSEAFAGVDRLLIISTDALDKPGRRLEQHKAAIAAAQKAGVRHIVYTSMPNPEPGSAVLFAPDHYGTEEALKASGIDYTILRNAWYMENLFLSLPSALASGQWYSSAGEGRISYTAREDLARAAASALIKAPLNVTLTLTGPESQTTAEVAAIASATLGKPISVVDLTDAQLEAGLIAAGVPAGFAPLLVSFDANTRQGGFDVVTGDIESLTGQKPQTLASFLSANKAAFLA
jgi:NAD(P)H dehydrogenase (quinone)